MSNVRSSKCSAYNNLFQRKTFGSLWKNLQNSRKTRSASNLNVDDLAGHYPNIIKDDGVRNSAHSDISINVECYNSLLASILLLPSSIQFNSFISTFIIHNFNEIKQI